MKKIDRDIHIPHTARARARARERARESERERERERERDRGGDSDLFPARVRFASPHEDAVRAHHCRDIGARSDHHGT